MPLRPRQVLLCLALILPTAPIWAKPDVATLAAVELALSLPADPGALLALAQDLADRLPEVTPSAASARPSAPGAVRVEVGQMQAALTQLSIPDGTNGHLALQLAQDGRTDVIYLLSGDATLADLQSGDVSVIGNAIFANGAAGIEVQAQTGLAAIRLSDNALRHNRDGLRAAGLAEVQLSGNDLSRQTPRQFAGDFAPWLAACLSQTDEAFVIPAAAGASLPAAAPCKTE